MPKPRTRPAQKIADLRIDFLSPVDRPAQEGAQAVLLKRHEEGYQPTKVVIAKNTPGVMTTGTDGHTHIVWLHGRIGETTLQVAEGSERMHDHPWVLNPDGTITIGENDGHTHAVSPDAITAALIEMQKRGDSPDDGQLKKELTMPEPKKTTKSTEELESTVASLTERLELQGIVAGMNDGEREHFASLDETAKREFVAKGADERKAEIDAIAKAAEVADPVVYTATDGTKIRKSDGAAMLSLTKRADAADKRAEVAEEKASSADLRKRADDELAYLPGTLDERTAMLKAVDSIEDEDERKAALKALKAGNAAMQKAFSTGGTSAGMGEDDESSAQGRLDSLVKRHADDNKVSEARAYDAVLKTAEGKALYAEMDQQ